MAYLYQPDGACFMCDKLFILERKESERAVLFQWARERGRFTLADAIAAFGMTKQRTFSRIQELETRRLLTRTGQVRNGYTEFEICQ